MNLAQKEESWECNALRNAGVTLLELDLDLDLDLERDLEEEQEKSVPFSSGQSSTWIISSLGLPLKRTAKKEADFGLTDLTKTKASTGEENPPVETNNIETVLDIDLQALTDNDAQAVAALDRLWAEHGRPTESKALIHVIGKTLDYAKLHGIHYPRIFLKRKGQLTRGEFKPDIYEPGKSIKFGKPVAHPAVPKEWVAAATEDFERKFRNERQKGK